MCGELCDVNTLQCGSPLPVVADRRHGHVVPTSCRARGVPRWGNAFSIASHRKPYPIGTRRYDTATGVGGFCSDSRIRIPPVSALSTCSSDSLPITPSFVQASFKLDENLFSGSAAPPRGNSCSRCSAQAMRRGPRGECGDTRTRECAALPASFTPGPASRRRSGTRRHVHLLYRAPTDAENVKPAQGEARAGTHKRDPCSISGCTTRMASSGKAKTRLAQAPASEAHQVHPGYGGGPSSAGVCS